eukprot:UN00717
MGAVLTVSDVVTNTKRYYNCPRCKRRVWAYGSFVGNVCLDCPGTVISAVGSTANMATFEATRGITTIANHTVVSPVTSLITTPIDLITGDKAKFKGSSVWRYSKGSVTDNLSSSNDAEIIKSITTKSCGILWGVVDSSIVSHWWMNIRTNCNYYQIQYRKSSSVIEIRKCASISDCDVSGLAEGNRDDDIQPVLERSYSYVSSAGKTMGELTSWIKSSGVSSYYSLGSNNCQHLCKKIYAWI